MYDLEERMKSLYEHRYRIKLTRRTPVIIRVDGRAFHTFTKTLKPFDVRISDAMQIATEKTAKEVAGCKISYVQSDEASFFLNDYNELDTEAWFDYNLQKVCSITASIFTAYFNQAYNGERLANFDARAFNIPREEVVNYFLWRAKDCHRNSVVMYAQQFFSHKEMHKKSISDLHEMLFTIGKNWATDLGNREKNGTFVINKYSHYDVQPTYKNIEEGIGAFI